MNKGGIMEFVKFTRECVEKNEVTSPIFADEHQLISSQSLAYVKNPFTAIKELEEATVIYRIKHVHCEGYLLSPESPAEIPVKDENGNAFPKLEIGKLKNAFPAMGMILADESEFKMWVSDDDDVFLEVSLWGFQRNEPSACITIIADHKMVSEKFWAAYKK
jgi:hypothetical protein